MAAAAINNQMDQEEDDNTVDDDCGCMKLDDEWATQWTRHPPGSKVMVCLPSNNGPYPEVYCGKVIETYIDWDTPGYPNVYKVIREDDPTSIKMLPEHQLSFTVLSPVWIYNGESTKNKHDIDEAVILYSCPFPQKTEVKVEVPSDMPAICYSVQVLTGKRQGTHFSVLPNRLLYRSSTKPSKSVLKRFLKMLDVVKLEVVATKTKIDASEPALLQKLNPKKEECSGTAKEAENETTKEEDGEITRKEESETAKREDNEFILSEMNSAAGTVEAKTGLKREVNNFSQTLTQQNRNAFKNGQRCLEANDEVAAESQTKSRRVSLEIDDINSDPELDENTRDSPLGPLKKRPFVTSTSGSDMEMSSDEEEEDDGEGSQKATAMQLVAKCAMRTVGSSPEELAAEETRCYERTSWADKIRASDDDEESIMEDGEINEDDPVVKISHLGPQGLRGAGFEGEINNDEESVVSGASTVAASNARVVACFAKEKDSCNDMIAIPANTSPMVAASVSTDDSPCVITTATPVPARKGHLPVHFLEAASTPRSPKSPQLQLQLSKSRGYRQDQSPSSPTRSLKGTKSPSTAVSVRASSQQGSNYEEKHLKSLVNKWAGIGSPKVTPNKTMDLSVLGVSRDAPSGAGGVAATPVSRKQGSPKTQMRVEISSREMAAVKTPRTPSSKKRDSASKEHQSSSLSKRQRKLVLHASPSNQPEAAGSAEGSLSLNFRLPKWLGTRFLVETIMGQDGSAGQKLCNNFQCTIDIEGLLVDSHDPSSSAGKANEDLIAKITGTNLAKLFNYQRAVEHMLINAVPKQLKAFALFWIAQLNSLHEKSDSIIHYNRNPFESLPSADPSDDQLFLTILKLGNRPDSFQKIVSYQDASDYVEQWRGTYPSCSIEVMGQHPDFPNVRPYLMILGKNGSNVRLCRDYILGQHYR